MNTNTNNLRALLNNLSNNLKSSKNYAHEYIDLLLGELSSYPSSEKLKSILTQIKTSAKIIDYANFTVEQEKIWTEIWKEATRILKIK